MEALYLLIPLSILIVFIALWVFFTASDNGQFDDLVGPGLRVLQDDDKAPNDGAAEGKVESAAEGKVESAAKGGLRPTSAADRA